MNLRLIALAVAMWSSCAGVQGQQIKFPEGLSAQQLAILRSKLPDSILNGANDLKSERKKLAPLLKKNGLPRLALAGDLKVNANVITNRAADAVLIVVVHETGFDISVQTHWLKPGERIPNRSIVVGGMDCHIICPGIIEGGKRRIIGQRTKED